MVGGAGDDTGVRAFKVSFVTEDDRVIIANSDQSLLISVPAHL